MTGTYDSKEKKIGKLINENMNGGGGKKKLKGRGAHEGGKRKCPIHCRRHTRRTRRALRKSLKHHKKSLKHHKKSIKHHKKSLKHHKKSLKRKSRKGGGAGPQHDASCYDVTKWERGPVPGCDWRLDPAIQEQLKQLDNLKSQF